MKPSWESAPPWANWLCKDDDGKWYWCQDKPVPLTHCWISEAGEVKRADVEPPILPKWNESLESRP